MSWYTSRYVVVVLVIAFFLQITHVQSQHMPHNLLSPSDEPITPQELQSRLDKGFDVRWAEFNADIAIYSSQKPKTAAQYGFAHARIRVDFDIANNASFASHLDKVINDTLEAGLFAILAKKGEDVKYNPTSSKAVEEYVDWWGAAAKRYSTISHKLVFDMMVEPAKVLGGDLDRLNKLYEEAVAAIRPSNPTRILSFAPGHIASAEYLNRLVIPAAASPYAIVEWHDFAAGPNPDPSSKKYWSGNGTEAQRHAFESVANTAITWQNSTAGVPTWFGAWMSNNFNSDGGNYTVPEQCAFATFICETMAARNIPWSINTYDIFFGSNDTPVPSLGPVLQVLRDC